MRPLVESLTGTVFAALCGTRLPYHIPHPLVAGGAEAQQIATEHYREPGDDGTSIVCAHTAFRGGRRRGGRSDLPDAELC